MATRQQKWYAYQRILKQQRSAGQSYSTPTVTHKANFNGTSSTISIPNAANLTFGNGVSDIPFSVTAWVNISDVTAVTIFAKQNEYQFAFDGVGRLFLQVKDGSDSNSIARRTGNNLIPYIGQNVFIVGTYDGSGLISGLAGRAFDATETEITGTPGSFSFGSYVAMDGASRVQTIGSDRALLGFSSGQIWDIRVHNSELTDLQISTVFGGGLSGNEVSRWLIADNGNDAIGSNDGTLTDITFTPV